MTAFEARKMANEACSKDPEVVVRKLIKKAAKKGLYDVKYYGGLPAEFASQLGIEGYTVYAANPGRVNRPFIRISW